MNTEKNLKILIIRFSSIGDIVLTTPVIMCLKLQANVEIHYLTKNKFVSILNSNPYVHKVHVLDDYFQETIKILKSEKFDYIIDLHKNLRSLRIKLALNCKSYSFNKLNFKKWYFVNFKINKMPNLHIVDRYFETTKFLSIINDQKGLDFFIPENVDLPLEIKNEIAEIPYIVYAIGAQHFTKRLPVEKIIEIGKKVNLRIILIGGVEDELNGNIISKEVKTVYNYCGKLSINQSAILIKNSKIVISHDTGMMHIAAAFKKKIISIWGNTVPAFGMIPYQTKELLQSEVLNLPCRPCSKIGFDKCPKGHFNCMNLQNTNIIAETANQIYENTLFS